MVLSLDWFKSHGRNQGVCVLGGGGGGRGKEEGGGVSLFHKVKGEP